VTTPHTYLSLDHDSVRIDLDEKQSHRIPLMGIEGIVVLAPRALSGGLIGRIVETGRSLTLLDYRGVYAGRVVGPTSGNIFLRLSQHQLAAAPEALEVARNVVLSKLHNQRRLVMRRSRDVREPGHSRLVGVAAELGACIQAAARARNLEEVRGHEGDAARRYFGAFESLVTTPGREFSLERRERRPPRGRMNALLSFLYTLATREAVAAAESVGLDPQLGFLHVPRSGRPALALDLVEEVRAPLCDRLALRLVNRRELVATDFDVSAGGAVYLAEGGRKIVLKAWSERRQELITHPLLHEDVPWGLLLHVQARLMARHIRGELSAYPAFVAPE
jgi:CRISPR-associated protein Cas1